MLFIALDDLILHRKLVFRIDGAFFGNQVADMAIGRQDIKVLAQILADVGLKNTKPQTVPRFNYVLGSELSRKLVNRINV